MATQEEQQNERDNEIMEAILSKSSVLEGFRKEYTDVCRKYEEASVQLTSQERENEALSAELSALREQISFTRRNIDEVRSSHENLKETIDVIASKRNLLSDRERASRDEIAEFTSNFEALKTALAVGSDWTPEQQDQRIMLEKERDFLATKLENRNNQVASLRGDIDMAYEKIQRLEAETLSADQKSEEITEKMKEFKKISQSMTKKREESEQKVFDLRAEVVKVTILFLLTFLPFFCDFLPFC
jgi:chromosome segregation ATPase